MEDMRRELAHRPLLLAAVALVVGLTAALHPLNLLFLATLLVARRPVPVALAFLLGLTLAPRPVPELREAVWVRGEATVLSVPAEAPEGLLADVSRCGATACGRDSRAKPSCRAATCGSVEGKATPLSEAVATVAAEGDRGQAGPGRVRKGRRMDLCRGGPPTLGGETSRRSCGGASRRTTPVGCLGFAVRSADFDEEERDALVDTGAVHLIAASGLHVAILGFDVPRWLLELSFGLPRAVKPRRRRIARSFVYDGNGTPPPDGTGGPRLRGRLVGLPCAAGARRPERTRPCRARLPALRPGSGLRDRIPALDGGGRECLPSGPSAGTGGAAAHRDVHYLLHHGPESSTAVALVASFASLPIVALQRRAR